ncbi:MAG: hypothetical protein CMH57_13680 [Myxococcales bacterium]|nr:hypothetical protein [Myxococcales bacterium]
MSPTRDPRDPSDATHNSELKITLRTHADGVDLCFSGSQQDESWTTLPWEQVRGDLKRGLKLIWNSASSGHPSPETLQTLGALVYRALHGAVDRARDSHAGPDNLVDLDLELEGINARNSSHTYLKAILDNADHDLDALRDLELLADEAIEAGDNRRALELVQNVMSRYRKRGDELGVARCTIRGAELMMDGGSYHKTAHTWLSQGLDAYRGADASDTSAPRSALWRARAGLGITRLLVLDERLEEALDQCDVSLDEGRDAPSAVRGALLLERAEITHQLGQRGDARDTWQRAISTLRSSSATNLLARAHESLSDLLTEDSDQLGAEVHLDAALKLARQNNDIRHVIDLSLQLSHLAEEQGRPDDAWEQALRALPYADNHSDPQLGHALLLRLLMIGRNHHVAMDRLQPTIDRARRSLSAANGWRTQVELMTCLLPIVQRLGALDQLEALLAKLSLIDALQPTQLDPDALPLLTQLADQVFLTAQWLERHGRFELARRAFKRVITYAELTQAHTRTIEASCGAGRCETVLHQHDQAEATFEQALAHALELKLNPISVYQGRAELRRQGGHLDAARSDLNEVLAAYRRGNVPTQVGQTLIQIADLELDRAELAFVEQLLNQPDRAFLLEARGEALLASETLRQALSNAERSLSEARALLDGALAHQSPLYLTSTGRIHLFHGDTEEARRTFEDALELSQSTMPSSAVTSVCYLAEVLAYEQRASEAVHASNVARQMVSTVGGPFEQVLYLRTAGRVMYILGERAQAQQLLGRFVTAARTLDDPHMERLTQLEASLIESLARP